MNKKAFTLVEIIVSIILIVLIGTTATIVTSNKNEEKKLDAITDEIILAAKVYIEVEKDEDGVIYQTGINNGGVGVTIPVRTLVNDGYLDKNILRTLEDISGTKEDEALLIASYFGENSEECNGNSMIQISPTWDTNKPKYICPSKKNNKCSTGGIQTNIIEFIDDKNIDFSKWAVPEEYYNSLNDTEKDKVNTANGIYSYYNSDTSNTYNFYRGNVNYNYLKLGKDSNGNDLIFRIIWYRKNDSSMKIILDNQIDIMIENYNNKMVKIPSTIMQLSVSSKSLKGNSNPLFQQNSSTYNSTTDSSKDNYHYYTTNNEYVFKDTNNYFNGMGSYSYSLYNTNNIYYAEMIKWFNNTTLKDIDYISDNKFCKNTKYSLNSSGTKYTYEPSNNFDCNGSSTSISGYKVGFLTYGEANMVGVGSNSLNSYEGINNYLLKGNDSIILENKNFYKEEYERDYKYEYLNQYYISKSGFSTSNLYRYDYIRNTTYEKYADYYNFDNQGNRTSNYHEYRYSLPSQSIKPALILNMSNKKLINSGTESDPFEITDK